MGDGKPPPPGGGVIQPTQTLTSPLPDQRTVTSAWAADSVTGGTTTTRTFEQILEDEKKERNILEIQLVRNNTTNSDGKPGNAKSLNYEDLGELLFDILEINPDDCLTFNFSTGPYDQREVKFKPDFETALYVRVTPSRITL